ncbi:MgtC/SapB family protein [Bacilliculturomica massiliensis]|uniref:MgtC/SapB family protein n=1 Tax=Bacilliculturomica massiliensis TaxID=1917867 RepID=UPI0010320C33|nr:MgtC/SapB family protein [Bacilliculturomica massiliensis]
MKLIDVAVLLQLEYFGRVFLAAICGAAIGYERENRLKMAGIRTHLIVAIGAALMMIVSKYGFADMLSMPGVGLDPSRIAAGVVTSIGFLGAGVIFIRNKQSVSGITTAAGLWATVGIGVAIGAGMYLTGIGVTLLILLFQILLHKNTRLVREPVSGVVVLHASDPKHAEALVSKISSVHGVDVTSLRISRQSDGVLEVRLLVKCPKLFDTSDMTGLLEDIPEIESIET